MFDLLSYQDKKEDFFKWAEAATIANPDKISPSTGRQNQ